MLNDYGENTYAIYLIIKCIIKSFACNVPRLVLFIFYFFSDAIFE